MLRSLDLHALPDAVIEAAFELLFGIHATAPLDVLIESGLLLAAAFIVMSGQLGGGLEVAHA